MKMSLLDQLRAIARREGQDRAGAEDVVQDALLASVQEGRLDLADPETARWLRGVVRNKARMAHRSLNRRLRRDGAWLGANEPAASRGKTAPGEIIHGLPHALRTLALLVLTGHDRREIAYLLGVSDTALRQRVVALKRHLRARGCEAPGEFSGLNLDLAYGRIRAALLPALLQQGGTFASHDPDGHLFVVRSSQNPGRRP